MAFTEFFCRSGGSNLNGGALAANTEPGTSAPYTSTNGNWNGTSSFTPTDGSTPASTVNVGDFASVYIDGASTGVYIARVTAVAAGANGAITLSATAKGGTPPSSSATTRTIKVGGAWKGPNGSDTFPFGVIDGAMTDASADATRLNLKNDQTYNITAALNYTANTTVLFQGYTTTPGDGGRFTLDAGTSTIVPLTISGNRGMVVDFIIQNNGTTGTNAGLALAGGRVTALRGVVNNVRGAGIICQGLSTTVMECEVYACNSSNTALLGGFVSTSGALYSRCIAHDNVGSNNCGFVAQSVELNCVNCIADTNGRDGFQQTSNVALNLIRCDAYNNGGNGAQAGSFPNYIDSCNFVKNGGYGVAGANNSSNNGTIINCGFGSGSQANTSGTTQIGGATLEIGSVNYASGLTPWVDPANGDFRINLAAAKGAGRGSFTQTAASYAGTIGYPDIGAAQHLDAGGAAGPVGRFISAQRGTPY